MNKCIPISAGDDNKIKASATALKIQKPALNSNHMEVKKL